MKGLTIRSLLMALGVMVSMALSAQSLETLQTVDIIRTKTGNLWKGTIKEISPDGIYLIETISGLNLSLHQSQISSIRQEWVNKPGRIKEYKFAEKGVYHAIELGLNGNSTGPGIGLTYAAGYRFSPLLGVGGGFGFEGYEIGWGKNVIPVFGEVRGYFLRKKVSPYYVLRAGYGFALKNEVNSITETQGGFMFNPQVGVRFGGGSDVSFYTGVGVHFQNATYTDDFEWSEQTNTRRYTFRRLELKFGIIF